jgi:dTDP-4-amino-4,6-dideoxygalactose transaminase
MKIRTATPSLPQKKIFFEIVNSLFETNQLSNNGPLVKKFTNLLKKKFKLKNLILCNNATMGLQIALKVLNSKKVLTTPFTFIATVNAIKWLNLETIYSDISSTSLNLDPKKIDNKLLGKVDTILPVNSFGNNSNFEEFEKFRQKGKKIIYDASHCFGMRYKKKSILNNGDASVVSLHATKIFNTCEGGMIVFRKRKDYTLAKKIIQNGLDHKFPNKSVVGLNSKFSELQAAWGLALLKRFEHIKHKRLNVFKYYKTYLNKNIVIPIINEKENNFSYVPIIIKNETTLKLIVKQLKKESIEVRRYFYPSVENLVKSRLKKNISISKNISKRILCLPTNEYLKKEKIIKITKIINKIYKLI